MRDNDDGHLPSPALGKQSSVEEAYKLAKKLRSPGSGKSMLSASQISTPPETDDEDLEDGIDYTTLNLQRCTKRRPTIFERRLGIGEHELQEEQEARTLLNMLNQWHKIKMERLIDKEADEKKLRDKILSYAERTQKVTVTKHHDRSHGSREKSSVIKAVAKKGLQSYKYQEVIKKQEALAEYKR